MAKDEKLISQAVALYKEGIPRGRICRQLGIYPSTLYRWLSDHGIKPNRTMRAGEENLHFHYKKTARTVALHAISRDEDIEEVIKKLGKRIRDEYVFHRLKRPMIGSKQVIELTAKDAEQFVEACLNPPEPSQELIEAAKRYSRVQADLEDALAKDPLDEPKQPRSIVGRPVIEIWEKLEKENPLKFSSFTSEASEKYKQYFTTVETNRPDIPNMNELTQVPEEDLIDIEAEDAKNICEMCGNLLNTEFCCKWEE